MNRFDALWVRLRNVAAFIAGLGIMAFETLKDHSDRPWLYAAAIAMMGLPVAREAENVFSRFGPKPGPSSLPTEGTSPETAKQHE